MKKVSSKIIALLPFISVFIFAVFPPADPDLGWHLKYGEYFFQHGHILRDNIFSTMMPGYHWANTSWFTDVITYAVFHWGNFWGLSLLAAFVVSLTFYFFSKTARLNLWDQTVLFPLIIYLEQPVNAVSFRGQQLSLLFLGMLFYVLSMFKQEPKKIFWVIPIFLVWANVNGEFFFGLGLFALWIMITILVEFVLFIKQSQLQNKHIKKSQSLPKSTIKNMLIKLPIFVNQFKKDFLRLIGVFLASVVATVVNPFGIGIHLAAFSHFNSPLLKNIAEYLPFNLLSQLWWNHIIVAILLLLGFIQLFFRSKISQQTPLLATVILVFLLSLNIRRYAWPAYLLIIPLLKPIAGYFTPDRKKVTQKLSIVLLIILIGIAISLKWPFTQIRQFSWDDYCQTQNLKCSPASAEFIKNHHLTHKLYTLYGWGGYLIWKYPEIKPVIDGRMHLWHENGYSAFKEYYAYEQNLKDIQNSDFDVAYVPAEKPIYQRLIILENQGKWKMVYEDKFAGIFVRRH